MGYLIKKKSVKFSTTPMHMITDKQQKHIVHAQQHQICRQFQEEPYDTNLILHPAT